MVGGGLRKGQVVAEDSHSQPLPEPLLLAPHLPPPLPLHQCPWHGTALDAVCASHSPLLNVSLFGNVAQLGAKRLNIQGQRDPSRSHETPLASVSLWGCG